MDTDTTDVNITTDVDKIIEKVEEFAKGYEEHHQKHKEIDELQMESIQICNEIIKNNEECIEWKDKRIDLLMETIRLKDERIQKNDKHLKLKDKRIDLLMKTIKSKHEKIQTLKNGSNLHLLTSVSYSIN